MSGNLVPVGWCGVCGAEIYLPSWWSSDDIPTYHQDLAHDQPHVFVQGGGFYPRCYVKPHAVVWRQKEGD